jgi:hypothetical protein
VNRLNDRIPGLPEWPTLAETANDEFIVEGKHISFQRYLLARWILRLAAVGYFFLIGLGAFHKSEHWQYAAMIVLAHFMGYVVLLTLFPLQRWFCWLVLRRTTRVGFSPQHIVIANKTYHLTPNLDVQFRASHMPLSERDCAREHPRQATYLLRFRIVEMVYGLRIVPITTVEYERSAEQFAVVLQFAYTLSKTPGGRQPWRAVTERTVTRNERPAE